jgi:hypothetical protein
MMNKAKGKMALAMDDTVKDKLVTAAFNKMDEYMYNWGITPRAGLSATTIGKLTSDFKKLHEMDEEMGAVDMINPKKCGEREDDDKAEAIFEPDDDMMRRGNMVCNMRRASGEFAEDFKKKSRRGGNGE